MTNNYFLHTDSLKVNSFEDYKTGMSNLVKVKFNCNPNDNILKHKNVYSNEHYINLCMNCNSESVTAILQYIEQCKSHKIDIINDEIFEKEFPLCNVGFMGINFSSIKEIEVKRQIVDIESFENCRIHYHENLLKKCQNHEVDYHLNCLFPDYVFEAEAIDDIIYWKEYNSYFIDVILDLLPDIKEHPFMGGKGKTEVLKNEEGAASKRINDEHRLKYSLKKGKIMILRCRNHYV